MKILKTIELLALTGLMAGLTACMGTSSANATGGELTGVRGTSYQEPTPYGMVAVSKGSLRVGLAENDTLWGLAFPARDISVDGFWMDEHEVSNAKYRQFVNWVRDSIIRERLADPAYGEDETYKIEEDREGNPVTPHLNWSKPIPWRKANEDEMRAIESVYTVHPIDGTKMLDASQLNYRYEIYDYAAAAQRRYRLNPEERDLNTDHTVNTDPVMISKDTAWIDDDGRIVRQTLTRQLSGPWDFLNTYIVNIYPDTTCWVNDFPNADNERYMKLYFSNPAYDDYPVVGVTWEQANAFCAWRTDYLMKGLGGYARQIQRYRLPTEIEWEYACRCGTDTAYEFGDDESKLEDYAWYLSNSPDGYSKVMQKKPNSWGLYDMHGNVCEWVMDQYDKKAYKSFESGKVETPFITPKKPLSVYGMFNEVSCGGSCAHEAKDCRSAKRIVSDKSWKEHDPQFPQSIWWMTEAPYVGFRVVRPLTPPTAEEAKLFEPDPNVWAKYKELNPR